MMNTSALRSSLLMLALVGALPGCGGAQDAPKAVSKASVSTDSVKTYLKENLPELKVKSISDSELAGIYRVELDGGELIHVSSDGKHIFNGDLLAVKKGGVDNLSEMWRSQKRVAALKALKDEDLVVFPASGEERGVVYAFTDVSCGYCQKMHLEMEQYNKLGITVKYLAWPRYGLQSEAGQVIANIWCSKDRAAAMTKGKRGEPVPKPEGDCDQQVVLDQIGLGQSFGVRGTPALFTTEGRRVGGYRPPHELVNEFPKLAPAETDKASK